MSHPEAAPTDAVLLAHIWFERGHPQPLRARVYVTDLRTPSRFVLGSLGEAVPMSGEDVMRAIQFWLDEFVTSAAASSHQGSDAGVTPQ
jgi:hypothetical protein